MNSLIAEFVFLSGPKAARDVAQTAEATVRLQGKVFCIIHGTL